MKRKVLFWLVLLCTLIANAHISTKPENETLGGNYGSGLIRKAINGKIGYTDIGDKIVINAIYEDAGTFYYKHNIVPVKLNGKWGFIDRRGKTIVPFKYDIANYNDDTDFPIVAINGKYGYLDSSGKELIPLQYDYVGILKKGYLAPVKQNMYYGFINEEGKLIVPFKYTGCSKEGWNEDMYCVFLNGKYGFINKEGNEVISPQFDEANSFREGIAIIKNTGKYGCVNKQGEIIYISESRINDFHLNRAIVSEEGKEYLINFKGKKIVLGHIDNLRYNGWLGYYGQKRSLYITSDLVFERQYDKDVFIDSDGHIYSSKEKMIQKEIQILMKWASKGDVKLYSVLGKIFYNGDAGVTDYNEALKWFMKASEFGDADSYYYLGRMAQYGQSKQYDIEEAKRLYKKGADLGNHSAQIELAKLQERDIPIQTDFLATFSWINIPSVISEKEYELKIDVRSDSKIENVSVIVNGILDRGIKTVNSNDYDLTIIRTLTLNEGTNVIKVSVRNAAGTAQEEKTIVYRPQGGELPSIEWLDFAATANTKEYQMKLGIKSKSKVEEVNVTVNGALSRGIKTVATDGYDLTIDRVLSLSEGLNRIVVSVRNGDGISTSEKVITYQGNNPTPVFNDKRIAFVIGNSHYSNSEMNLANPENDATDVAEKLKGLGFEVVLKLDATLEDMDKGFSSFREMAKEYDVALFYYAGHGIQSKGVNYLIPTNIDNLAEDNMKYKCVDMERVLDVMEDSKCKLKIVVLDACRNDPVSRKWHRSTITRGLSIMNAPMGTIISFSTAPGSTALDGKGRNSPYTEAFLSTLDMPNLDVFHFFQKVGASVLDKTQRSQNPWLSVSFTGDFYFNKQ